MNNWKKLPGASAAGASHILINPNYTNARVPIQYRKDKEEFKINLYFDEANKNIFAIEISETGNRNHKKSGFGITTLAAILEITEKTKFSIEIDEKGWLICTKFDTNA